MCVCARARALVCVCARARASDLQGGKGFLDRADCTRRPLIRPSDLFRPLGAPRASAADAAPAPPAGPGARAGNGGAPCLPVRRSTLGGRRRRRRQQQRRRIRVAEPWARWRGAG